MLELLYKDFYNKFVLLIVGKYLCVFEIDTVFCLIHQVSHTIFIFFLRLEQQ